MPAWELPGATTYTNGIGPTNSLASKEPPYGQARCTYLQWAILEGEVQPLCLDRLSGGVLLGMSFAALERMTGFQPR